MKIGKMLIAGLVVSVFNMIVGGITCGWLFNWVYKLEPANIWRPMDGPQGMAFHIVGFLLNVVLVAVYALVRKGLPGGNRLAKGLVFGLCVWAVGMLPGMVSTYAFMNIAAGVVIYWTILGLVETPIKGLIIAAIYGD